MLNFFAPINTLGYGVFSHGLMRAYDRLVSPEIALFPPGNVEPLDETVQRWLTNGRRFKRSDPSIMIFQAPWLNRFCGTPMIGFPIFELDVVPEHDSAMLRALDAVLQPSRWGKMVLENDGIRNVHVVSGGYDPGVFFPEMTVEQKMERIARQGVSFVHVGKFEPRKGSEEILRCFLRACDDGKARANLCFHVCNPFDAKWLEKVLRILLEHGYAPSGVHFTRGNARVVVPQERFRADPRKLYQAADFGIWASKAEGWNLPLLECLACGVPCLTTDNTAQADFIRTGVYPAELVLRSHAKEPSRLGADWWPLDQEELTQKIRAMIREPERFLRQSDRCLESVRGFTWENAAKRLGEVMRLVAPGR